MLLLHKLLSKLKAEGHKVQFSPHSYQSPYVSLTLLHSGQLTKSKLNIIAVRETEIAQVQTACELLHHGYASDVCYMTMAF